MRGKGQRAIDGADCAGYGERMKHIVVMTVIGAALAGCSNLNLGALGQGSERAQSESTSPAVDASSAVGGGELRPISRPQKGGNPSVDEAPTAPPKVVTNGPLVATIASLGNPAEPGLWLKTPVINIQQMGRVQYKGKSIDVTLIPIEGAATAGSRMSLQAFQALGAPLTDLVEVNVSL